MDINVNTNPYKCDNCGHPIQFNDSKINFVKDLPPNFKERIFWVCILCSKCNSRNERTHKLGVKK